MLRLPLCCVWVVWGLLLQISIFIWASTALRQRIIAAWSRGLLGLLGVKVQFKSTANFISTENTAPLVVANHISWLDIFVLLSHVPVVLVAKKELRAWPVLGWLIALSGTQFIDRSRRSSLKQVNAALTQRLQGGIAVAVFPEGTTSAGTHILPLHAGVLQAAMDAKVPIQPFVLQYTPAHAAEYIGDTTFWQSLCRIMGQGRIVATGQQLQVLRFLGRGVGADVGSVSGSGYSDEDTRHTVAARLHSIMSSTLNV